MVYRGTCIYSIVVWELSDLINDLGVGGGGLVKCKIIYCVLICKHFLY